MPVTHTNINANVLPVDLTDPNKITSRYESFTLIPRLGPLAYAYYRRSARRKLQYFRHTLRLISELRLHKERGNDVILNVSPVALNAARNINISSSGVAASMPTTVLRSQPARNPTEIVNNMRALNSVHVVTLNRLVENDSTEEARILSSSSAILSSMRKPNPVVDVLAKKGKLFAADGTISDDLIRLSQEEQLSEVLSELEDDQVEPTKLQRNIAVNIVDNILLKPEQKHDDLTGMIGKSTRLKERIVDMVAADLNLKGVLDKKQSLDDSVIVDSREWAFMRQERVELLLDPPLYRGPLSINSVAPNSELLLSSSHTVETGSLRVDSRSRDSRTGNNFLISNQIKDQLGTLYDYGSNLGETMSEQGFEKDSSRGEKRSIVESTLNEISEINASKAISISNVSSTNLREYRTEGKDTNFATTEVSFEAFSPVHVTHFLDGISAVWCPRIRNPYQQLRQTIEDFEDQVRSEYIAENYVADPAEPLPTYEGIERVEVKANKVNGDDIKDNKVYEDVIVINLNENQKSQNYFLASDVQQRLEQDDSFWSNALDSDQYTLLDPVVLEHVENSHIKIRSRFRVDDEPNGKNPDSIWLKVSVTRYKYTDAYLEQIKDYNNTVNVVNVARRNAVEAQAKRFARLKKEELIKKYEDDIKLLQEYTFIELMRQMFGDLDGKWSYHHGVIKSCINWEKASLQPEPAAPEDLAADGLSPFHFLNVTAVRFFLPLHKGSEEAFFESVSNVTDSNWKDLFAAVKDYITRQRDIVELMHERRNPDDLAQLTLDEYESEIVLGRHLEAVLSNSEFLES